MIELGLMKALLVIITLSASGHGVHHSVTPMRSYTSCRVAAAVAVAETNGKAVVRAFCLDNDV